MAERCVGEIGPWHPPWPRKNNEELVDTDPTTPQPVIHRVEADAKSYYTPTHTTTNGPASVPISSTHLTASVTTITVAAPPGFNASSATVDKRLTACSYDFPSMDNDWHVNCKVLSYKK